MGNHCYCGILALFTSDKARLLEELQVDFEQPTLTVQAEETQFGLLFINKALGGIVRCG